MKNSKKKGKANDWDKQVGERIRSSRLGASMTQEELGAKLGLTFQQIQNYEKGVNRTPSLRIVQMSKLFGVTINFLLMQEDGPVMPEDRNEADLLLAFRKLPQHMRKLGVSFFINIVQLANKES